MADAVTASIESSDVVSDGLCANKLTGLRCAGGNHCHCTSRILVLLWLWLLLQLLLWLFDRI